MDQNLKKERADRIYSRIDEYHKVLANIYENLVDKDFKLVQRDSQFLINELRCIIKSLEEDDF